jgi:Trk K+ transport system NAD-binding subunit
MKEFFIIILFALTFTVAITLNNGVSFNLDFAGSLAIELILAVVLGYIFGKFLCFVLPIKVFPWLKTTIILVLGFGVFRFCHYLRDITATRFFAEIYVEPLLICILGSLYVTNKSPHRPEFLKLMKDAGPPVYAVFFTIVGSTISLDVVSRTWMVALILTGIRVVSLVVATLTGGILSGDPAKFNKVAWAAYISPAGVSIGLAAVVSAEFAGWGEELASIVLAVIILNQLIGPPLLKWAILYVGESHVKPGSAFNEIKGTAVVFGVENQSIALAQQLKNHGWNARLVSIDDLQASDISSGIEIVRITEINHENLKKAGADKAESIVAMLSDDENYRICEIAYENFGTSEMVVRLNQGIHFEKFNRLGVKVVEPSTAIVSLLDNFIRSPQATSLLLGLQKGQDTMEIELCNPDLHGLALRDLRLPHDIIILSITRGDQMIISHGYTRLRKGDTLTMVGSRKSLEKVQGKFSG